MDTVNRIVTSERKVASPNGGEQVGVRRKRLEGVDSFSADRTVLFVHGATYPSSATFDLSLDGLSWMDDLARAGFDVHALDLPGYGLSREMLAMAAPAEDNGPLVQTSQAVAALGDVVESILAEQGLDRLCLLGWSWGSTIVGSYAAANPLKVSRLVLHAAQWIRQTPPMIKVDGPLKAYREVPASQGLERWLGAIPEAERDVVVPQAWREAWVTQNFAHKTPVGEAATYAPNGVLQDGADYWSSGKALYDPAGIAAPTLVVVGEWDRDTPLYMSLEIFGRLKAAPRKRLLCIGGGTHMLMLERNRRQLFDEVGLFLSEGE